MPGGGQSAAVPECDGARAADALSTEAGGLLQNYGGSGGGASGWIVVFDSKRTAKRFFKLVTNSDAQACTVATNGALARGGGTTSADLRRGRLRGVKGSITLRGSITVGDLVIQETEATVRRGKVVIRGLVGALGTPTGDPASIVDDWVKATAEQF